MQGRLDFRCSLFLVAVATIAACRTPRQAVRVGSTSAELKVNMEGLAPEDVGRSAWIYELSGCIPTLNGTLQTGENIVSFRAPGLRRDLKGCQFSVRVATPPSDIRPVAGAEAGMLYLARELLIRNDANGALVASAPLQKLFDRVKGDQRGSFTLKLKLEFPDTVESGALTGSLQCSPAVVGVGSFTGTGKSGEMRFLIGVDTEEAFRCEQVYINIGGKLQLYRGELGPQSAFTAKAGGEITLGPINLVKQQSATDNNQVLDPSTSSNGSVEPTPSSSQGIEVNTIGTERCNDNEVFDTEKFACQPK